MVPPVFRHRMAVVLRALISLAFLAGAIGKFIPSVGWTERFTTCGYPAWLVPVVGGVEVFGVAALWVPRISALAMVPLCAALVVSCYGHVAHPLVQAVRPAVLGVMLLSLLLTQRRNAERERHPATR